MGRGSEDRLLVGKCRRRFAWLARHAAEFQANRLAAARLP